MLLSHKPKTEKSVSHVLALKFKTKSGSQTHIRIYCLAGFKLCTLVILIDSMDHLTPPHRPNITCGLFLYDSYTKNICFFFFLHFSMLRKKLKEEYFLTSKNYLKCQYVRP